MMKRRTSSRARLVEVDRRPQGVCMRSVKYGPELRELVADWAEVVVDHVQQHRQATGMAGVDESLQAAGSAVRLVHGAHRSTPS